MDWELYESAKSTNAARVLNDLLRDLVNAGCSKDEVRHGVLIVMQHDSFAEVGGADSEPERFLERVLTEIYGEG